MVCEVEFTGLGPFVELFGHAILSFEKFPGHAFANDRPFASASRSFGTNFISRSEMTPSMVIRSSSVGWIRLDTVWVDRSSDHIISATKGRITCKDVVERPLRKDFIRQMVNCCRSLGRNRRPGNPGKSWSRMASPKMKFARHESNGERVSLTPSREGVAGLTKSCRAP